MNKQTVFVPIPDHEVTITDTLFVVNTRPKPTVYVRQLESVYVLTEQELEEIILKAWKQSRDGIAPTQIVYNIFNQQINKQP